MSYNWSKEKFVDLIDLDNIKMKNLPKGISVSTICASCFLGSELNLDNMYHKMELNPNDILMIKRNDFELKTLISLKKPKRKEKPKKKTSFHNSLTLVIRKNYGSSEDLNKEGRINLKIFKNGSVQMSGCRDLDGVNMVLNKLVKILQNPLYSQEPEKVGVFKFKLDMINTTYQVRMVINRERLYKLLLKKEVKVSYEPCIRACVIIKFKPEHNNENDKEISIFVFEQGNIIITGAKKESHIEEAYMFINKILIAHQEELVKSLLDIVIKKTKYRHLLET